MKISNSVKHLNSIKQKLTEIDELFLSLSSSLSFMTTLTNRLFTRKQKEENVVRCCCKKQIPLVMKLQYYTTQPLLAQMQIIKEGFVTVLHATAVKGRTWGGEPLAYMWRNEMMSGLSRILLANGPICMPCEHNCSMFLGEVLILLVRKIPMGLCERSELLVVFIYDSF